MKQVFSSINCQLTRCCQAYNAKTPQEYFTHGININLVSVLAQRGTVYNWSGYIRNAILARAGQRDGGEGVRDAHNVLSQNTFPL